MSVSIVVPYSPIGEGRERNWRFLRERYQALHPDCEVVEGRCEGRWSKGRAVNDAVQRSSGDVLVIADADVMVGPQALRNAIEALRFSAWVVPHRLVYRLTEEATLRVLAGALAEPRSLDPHEASRVHKGCQGGGITVLTREAFHTVGGIDEGFYDWGGEDISFARAMDAIVGGHRRMGELMWHLNHEPMPRREGNRASEESEELAGRYLEASTSREGTRELLCQRAYEGMLGGGVLVTSRDVASEVPLDPRFQGWGQEDESWSLALRTLVGLPQRGGAALVHLAHEEAPRLSRSRGSWDGWELRRRYLSCLGDPEAMRQLIEEARAALAVDNETLLPAASD